mmetsp:Transcript_15908/g.48286  ORF Transcript_15908/g.48286 Transcript_15908/m.48286 type:complete len:277 (+) Transcript_15908:3527-4357(+)|eukprot:scaffold8700_cov31-Tisochrysis_lutea.AAC.15
MPLLSSIFCGLRTFRARAAVGKSARNASDNARAREFTRGCGATVEALSLAAASLHRSATACRALVLVAPCQTRAATASASPKRPAAKVFHCSPTRRRRARRRPNRAVVGTVCGHPDSSAIMHCRRAEQTDASAPRETSVGRAIAEQGREEAVVSEVGVPWLEETVAQVSRSAATESQVLVLAFESLMRRERTAAAILRPMARSRRRRKVRCSVEAASCSTTPTRHVDTMPPALSWNRKTSWRFLVPFVTATEPSSPPAAAACGESNAPTPSFACPP